MLYVIVYYPIKKAKQFNHVPDIELSMSSVTKTVVTMTEQNIGYRERRELEINERVKRVRIDDVLRNRYGYDAFIQHLSKEFSMENLLSMTEFLQFKLYIHRNYRHSKMNKRLRAWFTMLPLDALPRSEIVYAGDLDFENVKKKKKKSTFNVLINNASVSSTAKSVSSKASLTPTTSAPRERDNGNNDDNKENNANNGTDNDTESNGDNNSEPLKLDVANEEKEREEKVKEKVKEQEDEKEEKKDNGHDDDDLEFITSMKKKAYRLYIKYIKTSSEHEINISYELRLSYKNVLDNEQAWLENQDFNDLMKLRDMFDDCCVIMKRLITHSFVRFKQSRLFDRVKKEIIGVRR